MSSEDRELSLVGKVELRIALAEDDKLQTVLTTYLPPLLLKLASEHVSVRNKVISTCQHIKIRLSGNSKVVLPVAALLKQYKENEGSSMIRHFDLLFIQQSIGKLSSPAQLDLLPLLLHDISKDFGKPGCATIFNLFLRLLPQLRLPLRGTKEDDGLRDKLGLNEHASDASFISAWFARLVLLTLKRPTTVQSDAKNGCPGLSENEYQFLTLNGKAETWDPNSTEGLSLTESKIRVLSFLAGGAFNDAERFEGALFAAADTNSKISDSGEDMLKRMSISLEDAATIDRLFAVYLTARPALQTRILGLLSKSTLATTRPSQILRILAQGITPTHPQIGEIKGLEAKRLRNAIFNFMNWISRMGGQEDLRQIAPEVIRYLRDFVETQGWPICNDRSTDELAMRALAYETLGSMARAVPSMACEPDLELVRWLFRSLTEELSAENIILSIQSALSSILNVFASSTAEDVLSPLRHLLLHYMTKEVDDTIIRNARYVTVRWADRCLEYSDTTARWIDILALGGQADEKSDVLEEGSKGLDPYWSQLASEGPALKLPDWEELVKVFFSSHSLLSESHEANTMRTGMEVDGVSVFGNFPGTRIKAFPHAVAYCRRMLLFGALAKGDKVDADWERQLDVLLRTDLGSRQKLKTYMLSLRTDIVAMWLSAAFEGMLWNEGNGLADCAKTFVDFAALSTSAIVHNTAQRFSELSIAVKSNDLATRSHAAHALGILAPHPTNTSSALLNLVNSMLAASASWNSAIGSEANAIHGSVTTLGYICGRAVYYGRIEHIGESTVQQVVTRCMDILFDSKDSTMQDAAISSIKQMATASLLTEIRLQKSSRSTSTLITRLVVEAKKGNEKAMTAIGRLSMAVQDNEVPADSDGDLLQQITTELFALHDLKQAETQFAIGEAIACMVGRWQSESLRLEMDVDSNFEGQTARMSLISTIMARLLQDCKTTKPSLKKASGIWLFCLVQHCGHLSEVQSRLRECQAAFMGLLSARDDLVQETASRGLTLVYERGDSSLREQLVADLVASFTGTTTKIKVDDDTELFAPGALPTTEGESITSYKDIMSLAAEVGDQSLVYKFMGLASNAATWSTRAAFGRFGLSSILSESAVDPKIYPKLFRYRFDPNKNVQRSMNDIWTALVKNPSATINEYFDLIMEDLLRNILGKEWRTRQASCSAIADLVQGRQFEVYEKYLSQIWDVSFKVLDDIKGSVREAAASLCKVLTTILVRQLEQGTSSKNAQAMLDQVIPFLFSTRGLESASDDVKGFSYRTVLKIVKTAGKTLLPYVPTIVEQILGLLSTLEPAEINYIQMNASKYNTTAEEIDSMRSQAVSHSPLMESVERCLDLLDDDTMTKLVPGLQNIMKTAIGMPSKVGCSGILVSLTTRHSFQFRPHADLFLKDIERAVLDRNSTVSASYARSAGYISRLATDSSILRLATYAKKLYFDAEDETRRQVSAEIIYSISKFATDRFNSLASEFLPFVFLAQHDFDKHVREQFEKTWDENVAGSRTVLLYLKEIVSLASETLKSPKWAIKHTAGLAAADAVISATTDLSSSNAAIVWPMLEQALALKTFEGKEKILDAFVKFVENGQSILEKDGTLAALTKKIALREAKRNNKAYRPHAFTSLGKYAEARRGYDMFEDVYDIVQPELELLTDENEMDTSTDDKTSSSEDAPVLTAGLTALFLAIDVNSENTITSLEKVIILLGAVLKSHKCTFATKTAYYERINALFKQLVEQTRASRDDKCSLAYECFTLLEIQSGAGSESVRLIKAEATENIASAVYQGAFGRSTEARKTMQDGMIDIVTSTKEQERSPHVKEVLGKALAVLKKSIFSS